MSDSYVLTRLKPFTGRNEGVPHETFALESSKPGYFIGSYLGYAATRPMYLGLSKQGYWQNEFWKVTRVLG